MFEQFVFDTIQIYTESDNTKQGIHIFIGSYTAFPKLSLTNTIFFPLDTRKFNIEIHTLYSQGPT